MPPKESRLWSKAGRVARSVGGDCPSLALRSIVKKTRAARARRKQKGETSMKQQIAAAALAASLGSSYATAQEMRRVVTGLDERNHSVVLFDSKMPLKQVVPGIIATNFWITRYLSAEPLEG